MIDAQLGQSLEVKVFFSRFSTGFPAGLSHTGTVFAALQTPNTHRQQHHIGLLSILDHTSPVPSSTGPTASFYLTVTDNQVRRQLERLDQSKAAGPDSINLRVLKSYIKHFVLYRYLRKPLHLASETTDWLL